MGGRLVLVWWRVPTKTSSKLASKGQGCIGDEGTSTPCWPYAMPSVMIVGRRCGNRRSNTISANRHFIGRLGLSNGYRLCSPLAIPPFQIPLLLHLLRCSRYLLLFLLLLCL